MVVVLVVLLDNIHSHDPHHLARPGIGRESHFVEERHLVPTLVHHQTTDAALEELHHWQSGLRWRQAPPTLERSFETRELQLSSSRCFWPEELQSRLELVTCTVALSIEIHVISVFAKSYVQIFLCV